LDDFRDYLKPNRKKEPFELDKIIDKSLFLLTSQFKIENIEVIKNNSNLTIIGFKNEFMQSFLNILNNAKDALEEKTDQRKLIFIESQPIENSLIEGRFVEIKIKDNAGGVPSSIINKVFEARFTTKEQSQGTGIGLYMTKEMIEIHMNGSLEVKNIEYEYEDVSYVGAEFTIMLPIEEE
jgi:signal transduction histidine kinase